MADDKTEEGEERHREGAHAPDYNLVIQDLPLDSGHDLLTLADTEWDRNCLRTTVVGDVVFILKLNNKFI